jgi:hypothetical protein
MISACRMVECCGHGTPRFVETIERDFTRTYGAMMCVEFFVECVGYNFSRSVFGYVDVGFGEAYNVALIFIDKVGDWLKVSAAVI